MAIFPQHNIFLTKDHKFELEISQFLRKKIKTLIKQCYCESFSLWEMPKVKPYNFISWRKVAE